MNRRGKRGKHKSPRRVLSASSQDWERWDRAAAAHWPGTWADWVRKLQDDAAERWEASMTSLGMAREEKTPARAPSRESKSPRISARISARKASKGKR